MWVLAQLLSFDVADVIFIVFLFTTERWFFTFS